MHVHLTEIGYLALGLAAVATLLLVFHLVFRPRITPFMRVWLLLTLAVFPGGAAALSTLESVHATTNREFCGGCHVMTVHLEDVDDPKSTSLAARHGKNPYIGGQNCYVCHANYGLLGYPITKLNGMKHVYHYYLGEYGKMPIQEALDHIRVAVPYPNSNCTQCHSGKLESFKAIREHVALEDDMASNKVACASAGCHGYSHPFNKTKPQEHAAR